MVAMIGAIESIQGNVNYIYIYIVLQVGVYLSGSVRYTIGGV